ncbi:MAG: prepilin-type N-terminal cleavage/methylation domain-containing protein [Candidatus Marinamargulisbacteria bacterium]|jgi:prepilin-type N-terminal cleavage/methylation domain-containing protein
MRQGTNRTSIFGLSRSRGFTILEVIMAVTLLVVVSTYAFQKHAGSLKKLHYEAHLTTTVEFLKLAHDYAQSMNKEIIVSLNTTNALFRGLTIYHKGTTTNYLEILEINEAITVSVNPVADTIIFSPTSAIRIESFGFPIESSKNVVLKFDDAHYGTANVIIFRETGNPVLIK